jgi:hypothetical protein
MKLEHHTALVENATLTNKLTFPAPDCLGKAITMLCFLPPSLPLILETPSERLVWDSAQKHYISMAGWLWHLLLGEALNPKLLEKPYIYVKPFAEVAVATFRLTVGVHPRSGNSFIQSFKNPASLWSACQWGNSVKFLQDTGLVGLSPQTRKRDRHNRCTKILSDFKKHELKLDSFHSSQEYPTGLLLLEAQNIAISDPTFHKEYLLPFIRSVRLQLRAIKDCKEIKMGFLLPDGTLELTTGGKKTRKQSRNVTKT